MKLRGFRIELGEVESVLNEHPSIRESVVVLREDIDGDKRLIAYLVVAEPSVELASSELRHILQAKLPEFMIPSVFVNLKEMPLTPNGKVDRQALPAPEAKHLKRGTNYVIPRTPLEKSLADIWAEILQLEKVGAEDNFFDLGGHSLSATRVISQIRERLQMEIPLRDIFNFPTVARLAQRIELSTGRAPLTRRL